MDGLNDGEILPDLQSEFCDGGAIEDLEDGVEGEEESTVMEVEIVDGEICPSKTVPEEPLAVIQDQPSAVPREIKDRYILPLFKMAKRGTTVHFRSESDYQKACQMPHETLTLEHSPEMTTSYSIVKR